MVDSAKLQCLLLPKFCYYEIGRSGPELHYQFVLDERLGIPLPVLTHDWEEYSREEQAQMLMIWETIRARIPDRIIALEKEINEKQAQLFQEEDFEISCRLNHEIAELASVINDLNIWFRVQQDVDTGRTHQ